MNRNVLKIIAVISMLIDHIGYYLVDNNIICRIIGRLAFPIFAFFIAEGLKKTRNQKKYILLLSIFAIISQIPYALPNSILELNILFTFLISIGLIKMIEEYRKKPEERSDFAIKAFLLMFIFLTFLLITIFGALKIIDYGVLGVSLVIVFYFFNPPKKFIFGGLIILLLVIRGLLSFGFTWQGTLSMWALISLPLLLLYNNQKGKLNLKYLFYAFYPLHLLVILLITIL